MEKIYTDTMYNYKENIMSINKKLSSGLAYSVIITLVFFTASCLKPAPTSGVITGLEGTVTIEGKGGSARPAELTDVIRKGDIIKTGNRSQATIEAGPDIIIKVLPESSINVIALAEKGNNEISLRQGVILSKIRKLLKNSEYRVVTRTSVASVRGTTFLVSYDSKVTTVAVGEGTVAVKHLKSGEQKDVTEGISADAEAAIALRPMSQLELLRIEKIRLEEFIPDAGKQGKDGLEGLREKIKPKDAEIDLKIDEFLPMSLAEIRRRYGRVDEVRLFNGTVIHGLIRERGAVIIMITPGGRIAVPAVKVRYTGLMK